MDPASMRVELRGEGWGMGPVALPRARGVLVARDERELADLLEALDAHTASGDASSVACGFVSYEAGVLLEGSTGLARPHASLPLAAFGLFHLSDGVERAFPERHGRAQALPALEGSDQLDRASWREAVESIRAGIERGDVYQVNLTRRVRHVPAPDPLALAAALYRDNPVPYALTLATPDWSVVSNSPELLLEADLAAGIARSAPIKGTIARGGSPEEDEVATSRLLASEKDAAEHLMIVDLVRNDLGKVSVPGGVTVPRLAALRSFRHLHHLESTVVGRLEPGTRLSHLLTALLPGGSITGAPKRASLGFIRRLEPVARGPYTGAIGLVRGDARCVLNVGIRTALVHAGGVDYHAGGGIVWDSVSGAEWEETETKSREFGRALTALSAPIAGLPPDPSTPSPEVSR